VDKHGRLADENVTARLEEYKIAWGKFQSAPLFGNGLGTKHRIRYAVGFGKTIEAYVGYVHNWPLYMLMVSGMTGCVTYTIVLLGPLVISRLRKKHLSSYGVFVVVTVTLLAVYGLFFAVFRLVSFNLLLAVVWAITLRPGLAETREAR
jgi:O-antigen ligase